MSLALYDRVRETTTVLGTNDAVLLGAVTGYQSFAAVGNANTCYYTISDSAGNWEVGLGTYSTTGPTLARTTVYSSSNANLKVNFPAGTKDIFLTYPSEKAVALDTSSSIAAGSLLYGNGTTSFTSLPVGSNTYILQSNGSAPTWVAPSSITGGAGGSNTQVQYNNSGALAGSANMTFNGTSLTLANDATIHGITVGLGGGAVATNTAVGTGALTTNSTGSDNTGIGAFAIYANSTGVQNTAVGRSSQRYNTASYNTSVGYSSLFTNSTGTRNTAVGTSSLLYNDVGSDNTALGYNAGNSNTSGENNVAIGSGALQTNNTASNNTAVGYQAGYSNTTGTVNAYFGHKAGYTNSVGAANTFIGRSAGYTATGTGNTALGNSAYYGTSASGGYNTVIGNGAGGSLSTGSNNTFIGSSATASAGDQITTGSNNTIIGAYNGSFGGLNITTLSNYIVLADGAGNPRQYYDSSRGGWTLTGDALVNGVTVGVGSNTVSGNTALGNGALANASLSGANNTGLGYLAGYNNTSGASNTFVGNYTGVFNTTGAHNVALGYSSYASAATATGSYNVSLGSLALNNNTTGANNISIGYQSSAANTTGANNVAIGSQTLGLNTASNNTAVGYQAGYSNTTGDYNTFMGYQAGYSSTTNPGLTAIGALAGNLNTAGYCTFVGSEAGRYQTTGTGHTGIGSNSLATAGGAQGTAVGDHALTLSTGNYNTALGFYSGSAMTSGSYNTIVGGFNGNQGGLDIRTASNYIVLSDGAGNPRLISDSNGSIVIGAVSFLYSPAEKFNVTNANAAPACVIKQNYNTSDKPTLSLLNAFATGPAATQIDFLNSFAISVGSITSTNVATAYNTSSDYRLKEDVQPMQDALATVAQLNPVTYKWKSDGSDGQGFIAHELQAVVPDCVTGEKDAVDEEGNPVYQGIDTSFLVATLTKAIQEQQALIESLTTRIAALEAK